MIDTASGIHDGRAGKRPPLKIVRTATVRTATVRTVTRTAILLGLVAVTQRGFSPSSPDLDAFFRNDIGLSEDQIADIRNGKAIAKSMRSRTPADLLLFGAIYIHAAPESYVAFAHDFERLRQLPNYLALGVFSDPPQPSDLQAFSFDNDDINGIKNCKPGNCLIQIPAHSIEDAQRSVDWSAPDVSQRVNQLLQKMALQFLLGYQSEGNRVLGVYNDKSHPTEVAQQFAYMLSYAKGLPERLPDFYNYLLSYPDDKPANVHDSFYWAKVNFGLKPTLRIVHVLTMRGNPADQIAYAVAEKQLYASHYFETALDLSFCVRGTENPDRAGFYLITTMGSEQAGLTGMKGSLVRKAAVGRSTSSLKNALTNIRSTLEGNQQGSVR